MKQFFCRTEMMMPPLTPPLKYRVAPQHHTQARRFAAPYAHGAKRQQVYLNTLAIAVVNACLQDLGVETRLEQSPGWQWQNQALTTVAELLIPNYGVLACVPILAGEVVFVLPPGDQVGCVVVQFDPEFRYGTLLGFYRGSARVGDDVAIAALQDFNVLLEQLPEQGAIAIIESPAQTQVGGWVEPVTPSLPHRCIYSLRDWLDGEIPTDWQPVNQLLTPTPMPIASVRTLTPLASRPSAHLERGKLVNLKGLTDPIVLVLVVKSLPNTQFEITVELWATQDQWLPETLEFQLLDEFAQPVMQAQARHNHHLQFLFTASLGDAFDIRVVLHNHHSLESFVI